MEILTNFYESAGRSFRTSGVVVRIALISVVAMAGAMGSCKTAVAQASPSMGINPLNGRWINVDPNTRSLVEIEIDGLKIHPYGSCHPTPCDWGVIKGKSFGANVQSAAPTALVAKKNTKFDRTDITLSLESDGRLRADLFTHFTDHSGRADYRTVNYFTRYRAP